MHKELIKGSSIVPVTYQDFEFLTLNDNKADFMEKLKLAKQAIPIMCICCPTFTGIPKNIPYTTVEDEHRIITVPSETSQKFTRQRKQLYAIRALLEQHEIPFQIYLTVSNIEPFFYQLCQSTSDKKTLWQRLGLKENTDLHQYLKVKTALTAPFISSITDIHEVTLRNALLLTQGFEKETVVHFNHLDSLFEACSDKSESDLYTKFSVLLQTMQELPIHWDYLDNPHAFMLALYELDLVRLSQYLDAQKSGVWLNMQVHNPQHTEFIQQIIGSYQTHELPIVMQYSGVKEKLTYT